MVVIAAGLAAMPRDVLEAARTDGATEWQVFRRVTVPLLAPVLSVVFITMIINVLKVFDLVISLAPGSTQNDANVIALAMWRTSFGGVNDFGVGSAIAVFLFLLVIPVLLAQHPPLPEGGYDRRRRPATARRRRLRRARQRRREARSRFTMRAPVQPLPASCSACSGSCRRSASSSPRSCPPQAFTAKGWWKIFSKPSLATWYELQPALPQPRDHALAARRRPRSRSANTLIVDHHRRARRLRVRVARVPRPRLALHRRDRAARRAAADGADPDVHALQHARASTTRCSGSSSSTSRSGCRSRSSCCGTSSSGSRRTSSSRRASTAPPSSRIFLRLILPLGLPAIASLAIFQFLWTWNDLLVALTFGQNAQPITVAIFSQLRQFGANIDLIAPASFISLIVPLAVFFAFQRYFVQGLLAGSVK